MTEEQLAEMARLRNEIKDCGQDGVCRLAPGCNRHLEERNRELVRENEALRSRLKKAEEVVLMARQLTAYAWEDRLEDCEVSDSAKHDSRELSIAVWLYDQEAKS